MRPLIVLALLVAPAAAQAQPESQPTSLPTTQPSDSVVEAPLPAECPPEGESCPADTCRCVTDGRAIIVEAYNRWGEMTQFWVVGYDAWARPAQLEYYADADIWETPREVISNQYDDAGWLVSQEVRTADGALRTEYSYYDDGTVRTRTTQELGIDAPAFERWEYDPHGIPIRHDRWRRRPGPQIERSVFTYDDAGNRIASEHRARDGSGERCSYEPPCPAPQEDCAGTCAAWDWRVSRPQGASACAAEVWCPRGPGGGDTSACGCDELGRLVSAENDFDGDIWIDRYTYTYDEAGRLVGRERDSQTDGTVERRTTFEYDEAGRLISETLAWEEDVAPGYTATFFWDEETGELVRSTQQRPDGVTERCWGGCLAPIQLDPLWRDFVCEQVPCSAAEDQ